MKANFPKAEQEALRLLNENFIDSPPVPVRDLLEFAALGLIVTKFADGAISGVIHLEKKYLYINIDDSPERQRFTIAHELGHWVLHKNQMDVNKELAVLYRKSLGSHDEDLWEQEANCFAANLLVPEHMLRKAIQEGIVDDALLAKKFEVSRPVIGYRRGALGI